MTITEKDSVAMTTDISSITGGLKKYQLMIVAMIFLRSFPSSWTMTGLEFIAGDIKHWCSPPEHYNGTSEEWLEHGVPRYSNGKSSSCERFVVLLNGSIDLSNTEQCDQWTFDHTRSTAVVEYKLVCDRQYHKSSIQSVVFVSQIVGALITGRMSDAYGRKTMYVSSVVLFLIFGVAGTFATDVYMFNVLRFLMCIGVAGLNTTVSTLYTEVSQPKYRSLLNIGFALGFQIPMIVFPFVAKFLHNWRYVQLTMALSALPLIPFFFFIEESPRWLLASGKTERARKALERILDMNKLKADLNTVLPLMEKQASDSSRESFLQVFRCPTYRWTLFGLFLSWALTQLCFWSTINLASKIPGDPHINFAASATAGMVGGIFAILILRFLPRKLFITIALLLSSIVSFVESTLPMDPTWPHLIMSMTLRWAMVISTGVTWTYSLEVLPTSVRNFGFSVCFCFGRLAGVVAPFMRDLGNRDPHLPHVILGISALLSAFTLQTVPETRGLGLHDTLAESEELAKTVRILHRKRKEEHEEKNMA